MKYVLLTWLGNIIVQLRRGIFCVEPLPVTHEMYCFILARWCVLYDYCYHENYHSWAYSTSLENLIVYTSLFLVMAFSGLMRVNPYPNQWWPRFSTIKCIWSGGVDIYRHHTSPSYSLYISPIGKNKQLSSGNERTCCLSKGIATIFHVTTYCFFISVYYQVFLQMSYRLQRVKTPSHPQLQLHVMNFWLQYNDI